VRFGIVIDKILTASVLERVDERLDRRGKGVEMGIDTDIATAMADVQCLAISSLLYFDAVDVSVGNGMDGSSYRARGGFDVDARMKMSWTQLSK